jgi:nicotinamide mononucleotide transporter
MQTLLSAAQGMSVWEALAAVLAIAYLVLAVRERLLCWYCAFVSTAIYTAIFWDVNLFMDSALNVYYMAMAVFGWHQWKYGGVSEANDNVESAGVPVTSLSSSQHVMMIVSITALSLISGYLLGEYSQAAWPYVDSFTTWGSVIATYLVARKYLENWLYWIVIDIVSIPLYVDRGLNLTALLFGAYVIIAIVGYFSWRNHYQHGGLPIEA